VAGPEAIFLVPFELRDYQIASAHSRKGIRSVSTCQAAIQISLYAGVFFPHRDQRSGEHRAIGVQSNACLADISLYRNARIRECLGTEDGPALGSGTPTPVVGVLVPPPPPHQESIH